MKKNTLIALLAIMISSVTTANLKISTLNITHGLKHDWPKRKDGLTNLLKTLDADIYGLQEVIEDNDQLKSIQDALTDYDYVGKPRSTGIVGLSLKHRLVLFGFPVKKTWRAQDEYCPIFYNKNKFELLETKTVGINGDGSALLPRIYTMARLKDKNTGKIFDVYNTHIDNDYEKNRLMQLKLITDDMQNYSKDTPAILLGDFNTEINSTIEAVLKNAQLTTAKQKAVIEKGEKSTHKSSSSKENIEADHIIIKPENSFTINEYQIYDNISKTTSDHNAVRMTFSLK